MVQKVKAEIKASNQGVTARRCKEERGMEILSSRPSRTHHVFYIAID